MQNAKVLHGCLQQMELANVVQSDIYISWMISQCNSKDDKISWLCTSGKVLVIPRGLYTCIHVHNQESDKSALHCTKNHHNILPIVQVFILLRFNVRWDNAMFN